MIRVVGPARNYRRTVSREATIAWDGIDQAVPRRRDGRSWADELVISADEKTSIQARLRRHPTLPPGFERPHRWNGIRWSFLIVRELAMFGSQGFNTLATGLPGHISRSVLADKLRKLEEIGLVARDPSPGARSAPYCLTPAGEQLMPTLKSLWQWAERWVPEDPAMAQRDPTIILWWLRHRVDVRTAPERQVALEVAMRGNDADRCWLLLARDTEPTLCLEDPLIGPDRYVYVEADAADLYPIARGLRSWADGTIDGSVRIYGEPELVAALPGWFLPVEGHEDAPRRVSLREPELSVAPPG